MAQNQRVTKLRSPAHDGDIQRVRPISPFDGLEDNNLGNIILIKAGETQRVLQMQGRDDMPNTLAVSCGFRLASSEAAPVDVAPVAILNYGVGGANVEIEFDLLSGLCFNVPATSFNLNVENTFPLEPDAGLDGADIYVQATMGVGGIGRAASNPMRRTIRVGQLLPGGGALITVPQGAVSFNVFTSTLGALGALSATQSLSPVNGIPLTTTVNPAFDVGLGAVGLVSGARGLEITNTGGANADGVRVSFTLAF